MEDEEKGRKQKLLSRSVLKAYGRVRQEVEDRRKEGRSLRKDEIGPLLEKLSSGQRLWYRAGAIAAWTIEKEKGREALVRSIQKPKIFYHALKKRVAAEV